MEDAGAYPAATRCQAIIMSIDVTGCLSIRYIEANPGRQDEPASALGAIDESFPHREIRIENDDVCPKTWLKFAHALEAERAGLIP